MTGKQNGKNKANYIANIQSFMKKSISAFILGYDSAVGYSAVLQRNFQLEAISKSKGSFLLSVPHSRFQPKERSSPNCLSGP